MNRDILVNVIPTFTLTVITAQTLPFSPVSESLFKFCRIHKFSATTNIYTNRPMPNLAGISSSGYACR
ncbi:hypothetical protein AAHH79_35800, partial [Burkholderia pseudomallei]